MNIQYIRSDDYFIPDLELPEEPRLISKWGRMRREYLKEHKPIPYNRLLLSGKLWTYLVDLNEQAQDKAAAPIVLCRPNAYSLHIALGRALPVA